MNATSSPTPSGPPPGHPEELLAGFVDGAASAEERAQVQRHLAGCQRCRLEVELAARARAALRALPQLEAPGLADRALETLRQRARAQGAPLPEPGTVPAPAPVAARWRPGRAEPRRRPTRPGWRRLHPARLAWGVGVAAAAALLALVVRLGPLTAPPAQVPAPGGPATPAQAAAPTTYDRAALRALADTLAGAEGPSATPAEAPLAEQATVEARQSPPPPAPQGVECARAAAGLSPDAAAVYLEEASFEGTPAYVAAFLEPPRAPERLLVVAVAREGCRELARVQRQL